MNALTMAAHLLIVTRSFASGRKYQLIAAVLAKVTLQKRTYEHQASGLSNRPVGVGQGWSTLAWIPQTGSSWALPLRHERITSLESPIGKAAWQLQQVCQVLPVRAISSWDSEYGCARFVLATADIACDKLMRLRSNRCL